MNPSSENAARLTLLQQAASLATDGLDPLGSATVSMRWARPAADGLLLVPVSACAAAQACLPAASGREAGAAAAPWGALAGLAGHDVSAFDGMPTDGASHDALAAGEFPFAEDGAEAGDATWLDEEQALGGARGPECEALELAVWHPLDEADVAGLHGGIYAHRPDAGAVALVASPFAATLACCRDVQLDGIPFFHPMVALSGRPQIACCPAGVYAVLAGAAPLAGSPADELAQAFADDPFGEYGVEPAGSPAACIASAQQMILEALGGGNACLVAHYGLLTVGPNPRAAVSLARQLEALCRIYWQALQVGGVRVMPIRTR